MAPTNEPKKKHGRVPKVNTTQASSNMDVLRMCLDELGWTNVYNSSSSTATKSDIYWHAGTFHEGAHDLTSNSARINKFPGMWELMSKASLTRSLNNMQILFPNEYDFYPKTWFLPEQSDQFRNDVKLIHTNDRKRHRRLTTFIAKPSDGSEGSGIYLIQDPSRCNMNNRPYIVQEYIDRPFLIDSLKFDIRIYVLILGLDPLEILLYDEGLVRFATVEYEAPTTKNLHETFMHLTNYSLNKRSANYKHASNVEQTDASKRKLSQVWSQLCTMFSYDVINETKNKIKELINKTILAILPELRVQYTSELSTERKQNRCFQIIGFDILLTDELKPILLEVNCNPSLRIDFDHVNECGKYVTELSPIDEEIKKPLVLETLKLVMERKRHQNQLESLRRFEMIFSSSSRAEYERMFIVEKIAFIFIEIVLKRGYKTLTNRSFRQLATICELIDQSTVMSSVDILYTQMFYKCKQYASQSSATGLNFSAFVEAFFLLSQRKYPACSDAFVRVNQMVDSCASHLNLSDSDE